MLVSVALVQLDQTQHEQCSTHSLTCHHNAKVTAILRVVQMFRVGRDIARCIASRFHNVVTKTAESLIVFIVIYPHLTNQQTTPVSTVSQMSAVSN